MRRTSTATKTTTMGIATKLAAPGLSPTEALPRTNAKPPEGPTVIADATTASAMLRPTSRQLIGAARDIPQPQSNCRPLARFQAMAAANTVNAQAASAPLTIGSTPAETAPPSVTSPTGRPAARAGIRAVGTMPYARRVKDNSLEFRIFAAPATIHISPTAHLSATNSDVMVVLSARNGEPLANHGIPSTR